MVFNCNSQYRRSIYTLSISFELTLLLHLVLSNFQPCDISSECPFGTRCKTVPSSGVPTICSSNSEDCICIPETIDECEDSGTCVVGTSCAKFRSDSNKAFCIDCFANITLPISWTDEVCSLLGFKEKPKSQRSPSFAPDFLEDCSFSDCHSYAQCSTELNNGSLVRCDSSKYSDCFCIDGSPGRNCINSDFCRVGEVCVKVYNKSTTSYCVPCESTSKRSPSPIQINGEKHACKFPLPTSKPAALSENGTFLERCLGRKSKSYCSGSRYTPHLGPYNIDIECVSETNGGYPILCHDHPSTCSCLDYTAICESSDDCSVGYHCRKFSENSDVGFCLPCSSSLVSMRSPEPINMTGDFPQCDQIPKISYSQPSKIENFTYFEYCSHRFSECSRESEFLECVNMLNDGSLQDCKYPPCFCIDEKSKCDGDFDCPSESGCFRLFSHSYYAICIPCQYIKNRNPSPIPADSQDVCKTNITAVTGPNVLKPPVFLS